MRPFLLMLLGLPGSGKTTLAQALAPELAAAHLSSDHLRQQLHQRGQYRPEDKDRVYRVMAEEAAQALAAGTSVVVDATFSRADRRSLLFSVASHFGCPAFLIHLHVPEEIVKQRLQSDRPESEADFTVYQQIKTQFAPITRPHLTLDTHRHSLGRQVEAVKQYLHHGHPAAQTAD